MTLVEDEKSHTYGLVFKVTGRRNVFDALEHLYEREIENGYTFQIVTVECLETGEVSQALTCIAFEQNTWFLGPPGNPSDFSDSDGEIEKIDESECQEEKQMQRRMALEIAMAHGKAGPNYEYLLKLAESMRKLFPHAVDEELFQLEAFVINFLNDSKDLKWFL